MIYGFIDEKLNRILYNRKVSLALYGSAVAVTSLQDAAKLIDYVGKKLLINKVPRSKK